MAKRHSARKPRKEMAHRLRNRFSRFWIFSYRFGVPVLVWMSVIFFLSAQPGLGVAGRHISIPYLLIRKSAHVAEYWLLGILSFRLFRAWFPENSHVAAAGAVLLSLPFAISDEAHQLFVSGRQGKVSDIVIDAFGIFLALVTSLFLIPLWNGMRNRKQAGKSGR